MDRQGLSPCGDEMTQSCRRPFSQKRSRTRHNLALDIVPIAMVVAVMVALPACRSISEESLMGQWKAQWVVEEQDTIEADLSKVQLDLGENHHFRYQITATEMMDGTYQLNNNLLKLYSNRPNHDTAIVQILDLDGDHMLLRMNHNGAERKMKLMR